MMNTENSIPKSLRVLYVTDPGVHGWCGLWAVPPIFASESDELCLCIAKNLKKKSLKKGEYMCRSGDEALSICFINRGVFSVQLHDIQFELLGPGSCFGEIGAFITDCRTMDVFALDDSCEILELFIADYNSISSQSPEFALIIQERLWELGNTRMQKLQNACKKFTKGADDLHPTALVLSTAVKAMKDLEKKRRVRIWHEVYDQETVEHRLQALVLTLPYGSKLRAAMRTLADAERIIGDTLAAALEMSGLDGHAATCLATCPWVDDAPKIVVAELIARSRYIVARCGDVLVSADEPVRDIVLVTQGSVRVFGRLTSKGVSSAVVPCGGFFGLAGVVPFARSGRLEAVASDDCRAVSLSGGDVLAVLDLYPEMYRSVQRMCLLHRIVPRFPSA